MPIAMNDSSLGPNFETSSTTDPIESPPTSVTLAARIGTVAVIIIPFAVFLATPFFFWGWGFTGLDLGLLIGFYILTTLGITIGFHRLFTHRSFETYGFVKIILGVLGSMAVQGPMFEWVALHRVHHRHSDQEEDPHSPHHSGKGFWGAFKGAWHAHIGWFFTANPANLSKYVPDLRNSKALQKVSNLFPVWVLATFLLPAILGGLLSGSWMGMLRGLIWGGAVRLFLVHHVTWSVNSACHLWGRRPFRSRDQSRNNFIFGLLAMGEGWHNSHHAFPNSARHGLKWWEVDISYWVIRMLAATKLAWNIHIPTPAVLKSKQTSEYPPMPH